jgi:hypothetical protein
MKSHARAGFAFGGALLMWSCSTSPTNYTRTAQAQQELNKALAGRVAGEPVSCLPTYRANDMRIIDDWTILFEDGSTIYLQNPRGGCPGIENHRNVLVTRLMGTGQLCSGDISHLVDPATGMGGGACVFGPFVPYTRQAG